jgi:hypothetical protein
MSKIDATITTTDGTKAGGTIPVRASVALRLRAMHRCERL